MTEETECVLVLTTLPADADAGAFARALVEGRVAACVNLLPAMESIYRWKGAVETGRERQILIKTTRARLEPLRERVAGLHPYEVPKFVVLPIAGGSEAYLRWLRESAG